MYTRKVICCEIAQHATVEFLIDCFEKTYRRRVFEEDITPIFHSDNGSQFTSITFTQILRDYLFQGSFSTPYTSNDNACVESFNRYLKERLTLDVKDYYRMSIVQVERIIKNYIDNYNEIIPHQANTTQDNTGFKYMKTPNDKEVNTMRRIR